MTQRGLCSATASVWGCLTIRPVTWRGGRWSEIARIAQVLPKEKKKKGLRPAGFYFTLYLPVLPLPWAVLSFGIQGWSKQRAVLPSAVSPLALIVLLREVKQGLCTYPGASSQSQKSQWCPKGKISSGAPRSPVNPSLLCAYWLLCYYLAIPLSYMYGIMQVFTWKTCAIRSLHCMPPFHTL